LNLEKRLSKIHQELDEIVAAGFLEALGRKLHYSTTQDIIDEIEAINTGLARKTCLDIEQVEIVLSRDSSQSWMYDVNCIGTNLNYFKFNLLDDVVVQVQMLDDKKILPQLTLTLKFYLEALRSKLQEKVNESK
jgi:hypothetical protein